MKKAVKATVHAREAPGDGPFGRYLWRFKDQVLSRVAWDVPPYTDLNRDSSRGSIKDC